jgi:hypothetical protein
VARSVPTSLTAACRGMVYSLVEIAALQGELNSANRTSEEINRMAQNQLVEAAQAMRKMKQHVEVLARTKREYESTINDMAEKLSAAEKANLDTRSRKNFKTRNLIASACLRGWAWAMPRAPRPRPSRRVGCKRQAANRCSPHDRHQLLHECGCRP